MVTRLNGLAFDLILSTEILVIPEVDDDVHDGNQKGTVAFRDSTRICAHAFLLPYSPFFSFL